MIFSSFVRIHSTGKCSNQLSIIPSMLTKRENWNILRNLPLFTHFPCATEFLSTEGSKMSNVNRFERGEKAARRREKRQQEQSLTVMDDAPKKKKESEDLERDFDGEEIAAGVK